MNKVTILAVLLLVAANGLAAPNTTKPNGPMNLNIDPAGYGRLVNDGDVPFMFDGYTISSAGANLIGENIGGIFDNAMCDMTTFPSMIYPGPNAIADALGWTELAATASNYSEATLGTAATLRPGGSIDLNCSLSGSGPGFPGGNQADLTLTYVNAATGGSWEGLVIPEPGTMSLLALGGVAMIRRRR